MCNDLVMKCTSAHLGQECTKEKEAEVMSWWDKAIAAHNELGVKYMVQPWMPVNDQTTLDDLKMYCDYFNTVEMCIRDRSGTRERLTVNHFIRQAQFQTAGTNLVFE